MILKTHDDEMHWRPAHAQRYSTCRVQLFEAVDDSSRDQKAVVIITEEKTIFNQSITNAIELLTRIIMLQHGFRLREIMIFAHRLTAGQPDSWDKIEFAQQDKEGRPQLPLWQPSNWKAVAQKLQADKEWSDL